MSGVAAPGAHRSTIDLPALAAIVEGMLAARSASGPLLVGLVGEPGAGKSTVAAGLANRVSGSAVVGMDGFHLPQAELVSLGRRERMGAPDTFDVDPFVTLLSRLRDLHNSGVEVRAPGFDRRVEEPVPEQLALTPELRCIVVEGNYLLLNEGGWERVGPLLDLSVAIVIDQSTRVERLIARHVEFGKSREGARAWALGPDQSNAELIAQTLDRADYLLAAPEETAPDSSAAGSSIR